jgi:hypothetical protein
VVDGQLAAETNSYWSERFNLFLPPAAKRVTLALSPAEDLPQQLVDVPLDGRELEVALEEKSGILEVLVPGDWRDRPSGQQVLELSVRGSYAPFPLAPVPLPSDEREQAPKIATLANVAPGPYEVCLGPASPFGRIDPAARNTERTTCAKGRLRAGQTLRLDLTGR